MINTTHEPRGSGQDTRGIPNSVAAQAAISRMRMLYMERRKALVNVIQMHLGATLEVVGDDAGMRVAALLRAGTDEVAISRRPGAQGGRRIAVVDMLFNSDRLSWGLAELRLHNVADPRVPVTILQRQCSLEEQTPACHVAIRRALLDTPQHSSVPRYRCEPGSL